MDLAVDRAVEMGCTTFQIFTRNPRGWAFKPLEEEQVELFRQKRSKAGYQRVVAHMPYLPNLATSIKPYQKQSRASLKAEVGRCNALGIDFLVAHIGSHMGKGTMDGVKNVVGACNEALDANPGKTVLLVETMAGQQHSVGSRFEELRLILDGVRESERMGVCFDTCLPPGSAVFRESAPTPIESIRPGDLVSDHDGGQVQVTRVLNRPYTGELVLVKPKGLPWMRMTPEHPVLCVKLDRIKHLDESPWRSYLTKPPSWVTANFLEKGLYLVMPRLKSADVSTLNFEKYIGRHTRSTPFPKIMPITEKMANLLGLYLAEGFTYMERIADGSEHGKVYLSFGKDEKSLITKSIRLFDEVFSLKAWTDETETSLKVSAASNILVRFFRENFGNGARSKKIPDFIMNSEVTIVRSFLLGYLHGDGNVNEDGIRFITSSKSIAYQLIHLLARLDVRGTFGVHAPRQGSIGGRVINGKDWFEVKVARSDSGKLGFEYRVPTAPQRTVLRNEESFYVPIGEVKRERYSGEVYNLTTESGTFLAPFVVTHNCHVFAAGFDLSSKPAVERTMEMFGDIVGKERLRVVHLNDSMGPVGSGLDRHEYVGKGQIGEKGFRAFLHYGDVAKLPLIMEVPVEEKTQYDENMRMARRLVGA
ncbi:MAG: deoxyribonuclease IV [Thaumarchaeota archaeon]|nr:deoxyribonuclease IV [Nitrososphaerota archaeon]